MPNYADAKIYTIRCRSNENLIYVGSSTQELSQRLAKHRSNCKSGVCCSLYSYIENNDWGDWYIELYEYHPCNSKTELEKREGEIIRQIGTINKNIAGRTDKEYYEDNVDKIKERVKKYNDENADKIKEYQKEYYEDNADKLKEYYKKYCEDNADKEKERHKKYRQDNADKIKEYKKEKVCCNICGSIIRKDNLSSHQKTKKCMDVASKK